MSKEIYSTTKSVEIGHFLKLSAQLSTLINYIVYGNLFVKIDIYKWLLECVRNSV